MNLGIQLQLVAYEMEALCPRLREIDNNVKEML